MIDITDMTSEELKDTLAELKQEAREVFKNCTRGQLADLTLWIKEIKERIEELEGGSK